MIEVLTVAGLGALVGSLGEHLFAHILHDKYRELERHVWDRLPDLVGLPKNHDVARAVRTAQLQALALIISDFRKSNPRSHNATPYNKDEWFAAGNLEGFINKADEFTRGNLAIGDEINTEGTREAIVSIKLGHDALLDALKYARGNHTVVQLRSIAEDAVLAELAAYIKDETPPAFVRSFRGGGSHGARGWFDAFSVCLAEQVKENHRFRAILEIDLLGELTELGLETRNILSRIDKAVEKWTDLLEEISTLPQLFKENAAAARRFEAKFDHFAGGLTAGQILLLKQNQELTEALGGKPALLCLTSWGNPIKSSSTKFDDPYQAWPPVKVFPEGHLDLEFGPFLLADHIYMDEASYDYITASPPPGLERAVSSLRSLRSAGYLLPIDYHKTLAASREEIVQRTNEDVTLPTKFRGALRGAFKSWYEIAPHYTKAIGREGDITYKLPLGVLHALSAEGSRFDPHRVEQLEQIAYASVDLTELQTQALGQMIRPYLEHVHTNLTLSDILRAPVMDWEDVGPIYKSVLSPYMGNSPTAPTGKHIPKVRELFSVSLAKLEPSSVKQFLAVVNDDSVRDFRNFVRNTAEARIPFDGPLARHLAKFASFAVQGGGEGHAAAVSAVSEMLDTVVAPNSPELILPKRGDVPVPGQEFASMRAQGFGFRDYGWLLCLVGAKKGGGSGQSG
jgi:hypothetical protein